MKLKFLNWLIGIVYDAERKISWMIRKEEMRIYLTERRKTRDKASKNMIVVTRGELN